MGRKKKPEEHENLERWLVSYADFITLLFATFVVLYALSQIDLAKFKELKTSIREAFNHSPTILKGDPGVMSEKGQSLLDSGGFSDSKNMIPPIFQAIEAKEEREQYKMIQEEMELKQEDELKGIKTQVTERGLVIKMVGNIFFDSSKPELKGESLKVVREVGKILKEKFPYKLIRVEGHTDNEPINSEMFPSNWELSSYRAASVVRYLNEVIGIEKDRLVTVGYADSRPIASNETTEGRQANRRVEIIVLRGKLFGSELKTYQFQKERLERLKKIEEMYRKKGEKERNLSDAARKLLDESSSSNKSLIITDQDNYQKEADKIKEKLKKYEEEIDPKQKRKLFFNSVKKQLKKERNE